MRMKNVVTVYLYLIYFTILMTVIFTTPNFTTFQCMSFLKFFTLCAVCASVARVSSLEHNMNSAACHLATLCSSSFCSVFSSSPWSALITSLSWAMLLHGTASFPVMNSKLCNVGIYQRLKIWGEKIEKVGFGTFVLSINTNTVETCSY